MRVKRPHPRIKYGASLISDFIGVPMKLVENRTSPARGEETSEYLFLAGLCMGLAISLPRHTPGRSHAQVPVHFKN
jgi:hypothetical protein